MTAQADDAAPVFDVALTFEDVDGARASSRDEPFTVVSGAAGTWVWTFALASGAAPTGTRLKTKCYGHMMTAGWQTEDPARRDYATVQCDGSATLAFEGKIGRDVTLLVRDGELRAGDRITVRLGDRSGGSVGCEAFWSATVGRFEVMLELPGAEPLRIAPDVSVSIVAHDEPDLLRVLGPSVTAPGEPFALHLVVFDRNRNVIESFIGVATLDLPPGVEGLPSAVEFGPEDRGVLLLEGVSIVEPGVYRIGVCLAVGLAARSNPTVCRPEPGPRVYWGELHAHGWGDCSMLLMHDRTWKTDPLSRHAQARRVGRYDYAAPGAMAMPDTAEREEIWAAYLAAFEEVDEPGRYVPFPAMEMHPRRGADRTLVLRDPGPVPISMRSPIEEVYAHYSGREDAILEGHIGGSSPDFDAFLPPEGDVVEVVSAFGNAEWLLQKYLQAGHRPAVTGASDLHLGLMGAPRAVETFRGRFYRGEAKLNVRDCGYGSGPLGALLADACTREALWSALKTRRGYATTGDRIVVELDAGGHDMGAVAALPDAFRVVLKVHGEAEIDRIDLIVGPHLARTWRPGGGEAEIAFDYDRGRLPPGQWFYFRVHQTNAEYAWTAPVWFADGEARGDLSQAWPAWNRQDKPEPDPTAATAAAGPAEALEAYLRRQGERGLLGDIEPLGVRHESMGASAVFASRLRHSGWPVTIRWFFEFPIPKIRLDWGWQDFGPVDCERGPAPGQAPPVEG